MDNLLKSPIIETFAWTLLHSIWQIAFAALWLFLALRIFAKSPANSRYLVSLFALVLAFVLPVATFFWLSQNQSAAKQFAVNFEAQSATWFGEKVPPREKLAPPQIAKTLNPNQETFLVSAENLRSSFAQNFSAASPFIVGLWVLGILFSALRLSGGVWQLHVYKTCANFEPDANWQVRFDDLCERLKIKQTVKLLQSKIVETPMVIGWLKPVVLIPASVFTGMNPRELETILAHELIHIRRYDYLVNLAQSFVEIIFFYHPAAWWISAQIRRERECACDDAVVELLENSQIIYATALANLEEFRHLRTKQTASPVLVAANGGKLMKRIQRIINNKNAETGLKTQTSLWSASLASLALISALLLGIFSTTNDSSVNAQTKINQIKNKKMAVGFVSIPPGDRVESAPRDETAKQLIEKLKSHRVPAIGFVLGQVISDGEKLNAEQADIVRLWRDAGFEIGIGGYKHIWFHNTPVDEYIANAEKNEQVTKKILAEKNLPLRYYSYPFLSNGKTLEDKTKFESWLAAHNLRPVKYTFDNNEWMYSYAYDMARIDNDADKMKQIRVEYLDYMTKMLDHFEGYSTEMFGRDIAQTLVLTPSRLVADTADEFFGMLSKRGYKFVSMDEAQADEAYQTEEKIIDTQSGISWFERWQMAKGKRLRDEPRVHKLAWETWQQRKDKK
jgi:beta-lactamase regulating signal transducer with metallopeptidase domain/peptidoglycan/xylan/chitin deacetylase (PgdA/CDA1 family)